MEDLVFYKDSFKAKEIAFVLGIEYKYITRLSKKSLNGKRVYIDNSKDEEKAKKLGLNRWEDYVLLDDVCFFLNQFSHVQNGFFEMDYNVIKELPNSALSLPELLIKVLYSKPMNINCRDPLLLANIDKNGEVWGCCPGWIEIPFGNVLYDDVYNDYYTRVIRLSVLNKTFCFCNINNCKHYGSEYLDSYEVDKLETNIYPRQSIVSIDKTCNLRCNSCRKDYYRATKEEKEYTEKVTNALIEKKLLEHGVLFLAGDGEVFLSKNYEKILTSIEKPINLRILSNGVLFTKEKWKLIEGRFKKVDVSISIDAATSETYEKLRHGSFDKLLKNLKMLGKLRKENKIIHYTFNFVVQRENMHEMKDFIKLAKKCNVDKIYFTRLNDWGTMSKEEYKDKCLLEDGHLDYELYNILQDPIFKDPIVTIDYFDKFMANSKRYYEKKQI